MLNIYKHNISKNHLISGAMILLFLFSLSLSAQDKKQKKESDRYMQLAEEALQKGNFPQAEANYRTAISIDTSNAEALYNMGTLYYKKKKRAEASSRLANAGNSAKINELKHKAYHNQGNAFMKQKNYKAAVNAYKNALRNDPTDDQTRYNLALAKKMLKEQQKKNKKKNNQNDKKKKKQEGKEQKKKDNQNKQNKEKKDKKDQGENKKDDNGNPKKDKPEKKKPNQDPEQKSSGNKQKQEQQPKPEEGGLSPQQVENLMEAMQNHEQKVQERINARKAKGARRNTIKNW